KGPPPQGHLEGDGRAGREVDPPRGAEGPRQQQEPDRQDPRDHPRGSPQEAQELRALRAAVLFATVACAAAVIASWTPDPFSKREGGKDREIALRRSAGASGGVIDAGRGGSAAVGALG